MSNWRSLFPFSQGGKEGSLPFLFENFGTFAGPQFDSENYNYDLATKEGTWHTLVPGDFTFKNSDLGAYLYNNSFNYVGYHCDGVSTAQMTLEASYGNVPTFNVLASTTNVNGNINIVGEIVATGNITTYGSFINNGNYTQNGSFTLTGVGDVATAINSKKSFDIPHPKREGYRVRHVCVEGPENGPIYLRGKCTSNIIEIPGYWEDLVDLDTITVHLTPIGSYQELFFEKIEWGKRIIIKNNASGPINCSYQVWAARKSEQEFHTVYKGETPADYPGDNSEFSIAGYDYDRRVK